MAPTASERARFVVIQLDGENQDGDFLAQKARKLELTSLDLARALAANPIWRQESQIAVVCRPAPDPLIGVLGYFNSSNAQLDAIGWQLNSLLSRLHYVDYRLAEVASERLAAALLQKLGRSAIRAAHFTAIPRGGHIVLGMLSYLLNLDKEQLLSRDSIPDGGAPLIVVDDCALSGLRFHEFLEQTTAQSIIFAHLYSHPDLRRAILRRESRVAACIAAHDLQDYAAVQLGEQYGAWRDEASARAGVNRYWIGLPEHICFPWNEPDAGIWNPHTERVEHGWRVLPPELCLKNRLPPNVAPLPVQIQPEGAGPLRPSDDVLFGTLKEEIIVGNINSGMSYSLEGVAADMWRGIVRHGNVADMVAKLRQIYDVEETILEADAEALVSQLLAAHLLKDTGNGAFQ